MYKTLVYTVSVHRPSSIEEEKKSPFELFMVSPCIIAEEIRQNYAPEAMGSGRVLQYTTIVFFLIRH